jgi:hypothetical protein
MISRNRNNLCLKFKSLMDGNKNIQKINRMKSRLKIINFYKKAFSLKKNKEEIPNTLVFGEIEMTESSD